MLQALKLSSKPCSPRRSYPSDIVQIAFLQSNTVGSHWTIFTMMLKKHWYSLWRFYHEVSSKAIWKWSLVTDSRCPCLSTGTGRDGFQRSLPTSGVFPLQRRGESFCSDSSQRSQDRVLHWPSRSPELPVWIAALPTAGPFCLRATASHHKIWWAWGWPLPKRPAKDGQSYTKEGFSPFGFFAVLARWGLRHSSRDSCDVTRWH